MKNLRLIAVLAIAMLLSIACVPMETAAPVAQEPATEAEATAEPMEEEMTMDIVDTAVGAGNFTTLVAAVEAAGLVETLKGEGPYTVFAPTDEAFAALPEGTVDALLADPSGDLTQILLYHVVPGAVMAADVTDGLEATTAQGGAVTFMVGESGTVMINDANIVATDIVASNGVIHVIDAVIMPPSDDMAEGETMEAEATAMPEEEMPDSEMADIVDIAVGAGNFTTLVAAVDAAGLVETLKGEGPFTVFAPTDEAFAALPEGTVDALLADPSGDLTQILLYHVVPGAVMAADVTDGLEAATAQGSSVTFTVEDDGTVMINDAHVIAVDIAAANGVIHVIDAVILPPGE